MACVYVLRCADSSLYIGATTDLDRRIARHNRGTASAFTATRRPLVVVYSEEHGTMIQAMSRERQFKRWSRAKKAALIAGDLAALKRL